MWHHDWGAWWMITSIMIFNTNNSQRGTAQLVEERDCWNEYCLKDLSSPRRFTENTKVVLTTSMTIHTQAMTPETVHFLPLGCRAWSGDLFRPMGQEQALCFCISPSSRGPLLPPWEQSSLLEDVRPSGAKWSHSSWGYSMPSSYIRLASWARCLSARLA